MTGKNYTKWTDEYLKSLNPCQDGYEWYVKNCRDKKIDDTVTIVRMLIEHKRLDWANWTIVRALNRKNKIRYSIFAAEQVIDIYEKKYPNDDRPRKAIEAAKVVLENDNAKTRKAAAYAASAAVYAAYAASAAADAASAAYAAYAAYAASAAAYAASAAVYAVYAASAAAYAASAAADAASAAAMKIKIIEYGISLLEGK